MLKAARTRPAILSGADGCSVTAEILGHDRR